MKTRIRESGVVLVLAVLCSNFGCATRLDYTRGETAVCEVHHQKMIKTIVPAHYGFMNVTPRDTALDLARVNTFPHAEDSVNPGCTPRSQSEALVYTCPECVEVRRQWETNYDATH
jgi:hypothetical protein